MRPAGYLAILSYCGADVPPKVVARSVWLSTWKVIKAQTRYDAVVS